MGTAKSIRGNVRSNTPGRKFNDVRRDVITRKKPRTREPVSPRNILAGKALNLKKPSKLPIKLTVSRIKSGSLEIMARRRTSLIR